MAQQPAWTHDELIVALDVYLERGAWMPKDLQELFSQDIRALASDHARLNDPRYRSPNSVMLKLSNFRALDRKEKASGLSHGSKLELEVWNEYGNNPKRVRELAKNIRLSAGLSERFAGPPPNELQVTSAIRASADNTDLEEERVPDARETRREWLLERAMAVEDFDPDPEVRSVRRFRRSQYVRRYVLERSGGRCEGCGAEAPFSTKDGSPYLETHHIRKMSDWSRYSVSDEGPDRIYWVIALCPTCHRRVHHGIDGVIYNQSLVDRMIEIEPEFEREIRNGRFEIDKQSELARQQLASGRVS